MSDADRTLDLYLDTAARQLVQGPQSSAPVTALNLYQGDTYLFRLNGLKPVLDSSIAVYQSAIVNYPTLNAALVFIDAPPKGGTWKARFSGDTTPGMDWNIAPKDLQAKLNALASVTTAGGLTVLLIAGAPVNEFVYQWNTDGATGAVEIVENKLTPLCLSEVAAVPSVSGQYFVKLYRAPLTMSDNFTNPDPPAVTVARIVTATSTRNEIQRITIPTGAMGEFALTFNGGGTPLFGVDKVTAADIETALNNLYPVTGNFAVKAQNASVFDVTFQGALAHAAQSLMGVEMFDQEPVNTPEANMAIPDVPTDLELLGLPSIPIAFEITGFDAENKKFVLCRQSVNLLAAGLTASTEEQLDTANAIQYQDRTVYVNESSGSPIVTAAAGASFSPAAAGNTVVITHGLNTWTPLVFVQYEDSLDPEQWRMMQYGGEWSYEATSLNVVSVTFTAALTDTPGDEFYFGRVKILVYSPDSTVQLFALQLTWDDVRASLPSGQTLRDKLAAIDSALGVLGGTFSIAASSITGQILGSQINLTDLSSALATNAGFVSTLASVVQNSTVINAIATSLDGNAAFIATVQDSLQNNTVLSTLAKGLTGNGDFAAFVLGLVASILQGGVVPQGQTILDIPDFSAAVPPPQLVPAAAIVRQLAATQSITTTADSTSTITTQTVTKPVTTPGTLTVYLPLSPAVPTFSSGGNISSLPPSPTAGAVYTLTAALDTTESAAGRPRGVSFAIGAKITYAANHWYEVVEYGGAAYAKECELEIWRLAVSPTLLFDGSQLTVNFPLSLRLAGNVEGRCDLVLEIGARSAASGGSNVSSITWTAIVTSEITLSPATILGRCMLKVQRNAMGDLSGAYWLPGVSDSFGVSFTPASATFDLRCRLQKFDTEDSADPRGALIVQMTNAMASVVALET